ncbi:hypothetical protein ACTMU2_30775 [Cupriavidus basilensis]
MVLAGVCAVIALLWFGTLGMRHLIGPDEGALCGNRARDVRQRRLGDDSLQRAEVF